MDKPRLKGLKLSRRDELYQFLIGTMLHANVSGRVLGGLDYTKKQGFVYFSYEFKKGDIILASGSLRRNSNVWCIGECVEKLSDNEVVIKDIFSGVCCNYSNESYVSVHNLPHYLILPNKEYELYRRFVNVCRKVDNYNLIPCGSELSEDGIIAKTRRKWSQDEFREWVIPFGMLSRDMCHMLKQKESTK